MSLFTLLLLASTIGLGNALWESNKAKQKLSSKLNRYSGIASAEEEKARINQDIRQQQLELQRMLGERNALGKNIEGLKHKLSELQEHDSLIGQRSLLIQQIKELKSEINDLEETEYLQSIGFYEPKYDFICSKDYEIQFDRIKNERKKMAKVDRATLCHQSFDREGQKIAKKYRKIILEFFDLVCKSAIDSAKTGNIKQLETRIQSRFKRLNKDSKAIGCEISSDYLNLRLKELALKYELESKKYEEAEYKRILNEQERQEKKDRELLEKARKKEEEAIQKKKDLQLARDQIRQELAQSFGRELKELNVLRKKESEFDQLIAQAQEEEDAAKLDTRRLKFGTIYVVSSRGSFEENVFRIYKTKGSSPEQTVKNMNPAVPFPYVVHFKILSEDVDSTLEAIHNNLEQYRLNKVNMRRDFFRINLENIEKIIKGIYDTSEVIQDVERRAENSIEDEYSRTVAMMNR